MSTAERAVAAMAAKQAGVVTRQQALACGLSEWGVRRRLAAGSLEAVGTACLRPAGQPESSRQHLVIGLLDLGEQAMVAGRSAAHLLGLDGFGPADPPTFLVPRAFRGRRTSGLVRSAPTIPLIDRTTVDDLPCTTASRTIIDLMGEVSVRELENAVDSALRLGATSEPYLRHRLAELRRRGLKGTRVLDDVLDGSGGHSRLERTFLGLVRRAGRQSRPANGSFEAASVSLPAPISPSPTPRSSARLLGTPLTPRVASASTTSSDVPSSSSSVSWC